MIHAIRKIFQSRLGVALTLAFLALIALAFASADVSSVGTFGGVAGGDRVAVVGDAKIDSGELAGAAQGEVRNLQQDDPTLSMQSFLSQGGLDQTLNRLIDRTALAQFARTLGFRAGDNLLNSEIRQIGAFRGPSGNFDEAAYRAAIARQGLTDQQVRDDLGAGLLAQQVLVPASFGATMPKALVRRYAGLFKEQRDGAIGFVPSAAFAPSGDPSAEQLQSYYGAHRDDYIRPERRTIRYATFGTDAIGKAAQPTDAEIHAYYRENAAQYSPSEERRLSQLIVPTQAAAKKIAASVRDGGSLAQAASQASLAVSEVGPISRADYAGRTSPAVAQAVFETPEGQVAAPTRSALGWYVVRVDGVERRGGRSLAQAREEIVATLRQQKQRQAISDLAAKVEQRVSEGASLADVAQDVGAKVQTTRPLLASGQVYGTQNDSAPDVLRSALQTAFQMNEGQPQLAEIDPGKTFLLFEASDITPSAAAPLRDIRERVVADWKRSRGSAQAKQAADRIIARVAKGQSLGAAFAAEKTRLPPVDAVNLTREQLLQRGQGVAPPLALFFSMAKGTAKRLEAPANGGWFVIDVDDIKPGAFDGTDAQLAQAGREFGTAAGREYAEQLRTAIRKDVGVDRNAQAIDAVRRRLAGES